MSLRLVFAGTPAVALPALDALVDSEHEVVGVVTRPDAPAGRGRRLVESPVAARAAELGIPVLKPQHPREPEFQSALTALAPDCCPVVAYGALLPQSALDIPRFGWINLHFSCLPAWRGAAPVQHAVWAGDEVTGATTFRIVKALDAGPVFGVMTERIRDDDTSGTLLDRLATGGAGLLVATLDALGQGAIDAREQQEEGVSLAPKISVDDARVDWSEPAVAVDRRVRACTPDPGAWSTHEGERIKLGPVTLTDEALPPGVLEVRKREVLVGTGSVAVRLGEVKAHGRKLMPAPDWARGARLESGVRFGGIETPVPDVEPRVDG